MSRNSKCPEKEINLEKETIKKQIHIFMIKKTLIQILNEKRNGNLHINV